MAGVASQDRLPRDWGLDEEELKEMEEEAEELAELVLVRGRRWVDAWRLLWLAGFNVEDATLHVRGPGSLMLEVVVDKAFIDDFAAGCREEVGGGDDAVRDCVKRRVEEFAGETLAFPEPVEKVYHTELGKLRARAYSYIDKDEDEGVLWACDAVVIELEDGMAGRAPMEAFKTLVLEAVKVYKDLLFGAT